MKALVTGGAGFIGSHLAEALCRRGLQVVVLDDLSLGKPENLAWRRADDSLEFISGDVRDPQVVRAAVAGCDWVFHEAALPSVPGSVAEPARYHAVNLDATLGLLIAARDAGVRRFVFASSSAIYGESDAPVKRESDAPRPMSPYALQKYASERYGQLFHQLFALPTVSLRYFNVFGPRQSFDSPYSGVIAKFCTAMVEGHPVTVFGDGQQSRDFVFIDNVVRANLLAADRPAEQVAGRVFNVGGGASITVLALVAELQRLTGRSDAVRFAPARAGDVRASCADLAAAREGLTYAPTVTWQSGLQRTLDFYRGSVRVRPGPAETA